MSSYKGEERRKIQNLVCVHHSGLSTSLLNIENRLESIDKKVEGIPALVERSSIHRGWLYTITVGLISVFLWILKKTI
jgi:tetrahydromethanopterin S-methyltransferase subunit G